MFGMNRNQITRALLACLMAFILALGLVIESRAAENRRTFEGSRVSEVSPPEVIQELRQLLELNQPQVEIISPQLNEVLQDNTVVVKLKIEGLSLFKDAKLGLGPHLQVFLDNQPSQSIYDLNQPLALQDLTPGTHTLQIFATYPWDESFKNEGAYAQTTFHIFTKTQNNNLNSALPLLTYNRPQGSYGAEPIMLDFYLTNAPLHLVAQEHADDNIVDWQIRCTINGSSFIIDRWQPIYLKGFKPGKNWVQLEFLDQNGKLVQSVFNNTIRLVTYEPGGKDTLSQLIQGELNLADARGIVDSDYVAETLVPTPTPSPSTSPSPIPVPESSPSIAPSPSVSPPAGGVSSTKVPETTQEPSPNLEPTAPTEQKQPSESAETGSTDKQPDKPIENFFNRFRRPSTDTPSPSLPPTLPEVIVTPRPSEQATPTPELAPDEIPSPMPSGQISPTEQLSPSPLGASTPTKASEDRQQPATTSEPQPSIMPPERPMSGVKLPEPNETKVVEPKQQEEPEPNKLFDSSSAPSALPEEGLQPQDLTPSVTPEVQVVPQPTSKPKSSSSFKNFRERYFLRTQNPVNPKDPKKSQPSTLEEKTAE